MEKITNKKFIDYVRSEDKRILVRFESAIQELENLTEKRIINKNDQNKSIEYINIKHFLERYINATKFKFLDLSIGLVSCINSGSISGALTISRTLLENSAMLHLKSSEFIKLLNNKNYIKLLHELLKMNVRYESKYRVKDYKRTHLNDALKYFSKEVIGEEGFTSGLYDKVSERVHPSPSSFMMYIDAMNIKKRNKYQNSFSLNSKDIQNQYSFILLIMLDFALIIEILYPKIQIDLINFLKDSKLAVEIYFNHSEYNKKHNELIKQYNT